MPTRRMTSQTSRIVSRAGLIDRDPEFHKAIDCRSTYVSPNCPGCPSFRLGWPMLKFMSSGRPLPNAPRQEVGPDRTPGADAGCPGRRSHGPAPLHLGYGRHSRYPSDPPSNVPLADGSPCTLTAANDTAKTGDRLTGSE